MLESHNGSIGGLAGETDQHRIAARLLGLARTPVQRGVQSEL